MLEFWYIKRRWANGVPPTLLFLIQTEAKTNNFYFWASHASLKVSMNPTHPQQRSGSIRLCWQ